MLNELIYANFLIGINKKENISDSLLTDFINNFNNEEKIYPLLVFLSQLTLKQAINFDYEEEYNYMSKLVKMAIKILNLNYSDEEIELLINMVCTVLAANTEYNYFNDNFFVEHAAKYCTSSADYSKSEDDTLFFAWYVINLKALKIALRDFHANSSYIISLASNANANQEREQKINFNGKGLLLK